MLAKSRINNGLLLQVIIQIIILIIGATFTYSQHIQYQRERNAVISTALNNRLSSLSTGIINRVNLYQYGLFGLKGFIHGIGIDNLNYQAMQNYSNSRNYTLEFPGADGIGFIKRVSPAHLAQFLEHAKNERPDNTFSLKSLKDDNDEHFIIQYIFPEKNNSKALGLDIGSENIRRQAALNSAINNSTQLSAPITLVQADKKPQQGFLILLPVYQQNIVPKNTQHRLEKLVGWTYAPLLINNILESLSQVDENSLSISDLNNSTEFTFFNYGNKNNNTAFQTSNTINIMGRSWKVTLHGSQSFIANLHLANKYQALVDGVFLTVFSMFFIFALQLFFYRRAQRIKLKVEAAKKHEQILEQANSKLEIEVKLRTQQIADISTLQRSILDSASYSIIATDKDGLITEFNPAAEKLLGYKASEIIGIKNPSIFHVEDEVVKKAQQLTKELNKPIKPGFEVFVVKATPTEPDINQWTYIDSNGKHIQINLSITSLLNNRGQVVGFLGIAFDLTQQIKHEEALAQAKELAEQSSKAKSEFLANMSHEIRTPMNGILGTLQLLQEQPLNEKSQEYLKKSLYSTRALTTIINDILDFSKIEAGKLSLESMHFELNELINHLESDLALFANEKGIYLRFISNIDHNYWIGDPVRLRQIFINLISNAIKFTHEGGVTVEFKLTDDNKIYGIVSDTGIGISQNAIDRLFERFEQAETSTTREYGGTGLGLPITKSLISLMKGEIKVTSTLNSGSQFCVYLPLKKANIKAIDLNTKYLEFPDLSNKTILIAEDNKINQLVATAMLEPTKANIVIANNGLEAIALYESLLPDIILMDIQMPKMDGFEACKKINSKQVIIALTANVFTEQKELYKQLFDGYISKPIEKQELIKALHMNNTEENI
ncbi:CHASE domain-containing protein [Pseudoalteromonas sp. 1_2015MBL_MicDiv]|uniref:CHASE domain-containing protein n=1 Tax=Pseudoalteromonas sp. 1_2015MBL_MicDiv TaxID=1720343 RepID=UPI000BBE2E98|nr:CHASE domain-containing protein [Pseudoalteromonas sp. 1_2015MBL_MicDiv]ATG77989.1 histidine kinase [Pseudoalteromonas sp. 1_2015MBL_MicDiv]